LVSLLAAAVEQEKNNRKDQFVKRSQACAGKSDIFIRYQNLLTNGSTSRDGTELKQTIEYWAIISQVDYIFKNK